MQSSLPFSDWPHPEQLVVEQDDGRSAKSDAVAVEQLGRVLRLQVGFNEWNRRDVPDMRAQARMSSGPRRGCSQTDGMHLPKVSEISDRVHPPYHADGDESIIPPESPGTASLVQAQCDGECCEECENHIQGDQEVAVGFWVCVVALGPACDDRGGWKLGHGQGMFVCMSRLALRSQIVLRNSMQLYHGHPQSSMSHQDGPESKQSQD